MSDKVILKPIPELTRDNPADRLVEFYEKLGWNTEDIIDPQKIKMYRDDLLKLVDAEIEHARKMQNKSSEPNSELLVGFLWMNKGPSGSGGTPGMVELHPGWVVSETKSKEGVA